eukprot:scaffold125402_cov69-Phaeocystis_antarctica.AAC.1
MAHGGGEPRPRVPRLCLTTGAALEDFVEGFVWRHNTDITLPYLMPEARARGGPAPHHLHPRKLSQLIAPERLVLPSAAARSLASVVPLVRWLHVGNDGGVVRRVAVEPQPLALAPPDRRARNLAPLAAAQARARLHGLAVVEAALAAVGLHVALVRRAVAPLRLHERRVGVCSNVCIRWAARSYIWIY